MNRIYLAFISILLLTQQAKAQQPTPLSVQDCMDYAMKHNYTIKNAELDVLIQKAQVGEQISAAYPHINGKAEFDDNVIPQRTLFNTGSFAAFLPAGTIPPTGDGYTAIQISPRYAGSAALSGSQTLFDGSVLVALQARNTVVEMARRTSEVTSEGIRYNIIKAYYALVISYRQYAITVDALSFARSLEHDMMITQQTGFAEKIDVERTSVQVNNLATDSIRIGNLLTTSEQVLKYQIGMDINTPIVLTDTSLDARRDEVLKLLEEEKNYSRVPEYNMYETQLSLNKYNLKRYELAALPTLNLISSAGYNYSTEYLSDMFHFPNYLSSFMYGIQLNVPIFNGFMRRYQVQEAKLNIEKSNNNIEYIKQTIDFQSAQSKTTLRNAVLQTQSQHRNLDLANDVLDLARRKYKAGVGSNIEVTQAQSDQLQAQTNYFNALLDLVNAEADLKKALGLLK